MLEYFGLNTIMYLATPFIRKLKHNRIVLDTRCLIISYSTIDSQVTLPMIAKPIP